MHLGRQPQTVDDAGQPLPVAVAADVFKTTLELLVGAHGVAQSGAVLVQAGESFFRRAQARLERGGLAERVREVVVHGPVAGQLRRLLVQPEAPSAGAGDRPHVGVLGAGHQAQQGRLAAAVAADEDDMIVGADGEGGAGEEPPAAVGLLDVVEGDDAHR